jgi:outer membrane lipoprotein-sorting protein
VTKAIKASGGEAKVAALRAGTCKMKANIQDGNQEIAATLDVTWQGLDQYRIVLAGDFNGRAKNAVIVLNGDQGWLKDVDNNRVEKAPKEAVPLISATVYAMRMPHLLSSLLDKDVKLSPLGEIKIGDRAAIGVTVARKDRKDVSLFFDKDNGLPVQSTIQVTDPRGKEMTFEFAYSEFKETDGHKHPTRISLRIEKADVVLEISEVKGQPKVDPDAFAAPQ